MKERVTQRFLKYVAVDTQSDEASDTFPSTEKQKVLAKMLVEELRRMGVPQVMQWELFRHRDSSLGSR